MMEDASMEEMKMEEVEIKKLIQDTCWKKIGAILDSLCGKEEALQIAEALDKEELELRKRLMFVETLKEMRNIKVVSDFIP